MLSLVLINTMPGSYEQPSILPKQLEGVPIKENIGSSPFQAIKVGIDHIFKHQANQSCRRIA